MPESLTFHASRTKSVLIFLGCVAFFIGGYALRIDKPVIACGPA